MNENHAIDIINAFIQFYYVDRNLGSLLACFSETIQWVSTDTITGILVLESRLKDEFTQYPQAVTTQVNIVSEQQLSADISLFTIAGSTTVDSQFSGINGTICCKKTNNRWLINHVHLSSPGYSSKQNSARTQTETTDNISNYKMTSLLNAVPAGIGIFVFADTLRCHYYSDGFARMAGITRAEMDQKIADNTVLSSIISPLDFPEVAPILARDTAKGLPLNMTYRYIYSDGSTRWLHLTAEKVGEEDGYPIYYCVFTTPTEDTALYRNITEDSRNGVLVAEFNTKNLVYINTAAARFYGLSSLSEAIGNSLRSILEKHGLSMFLTQDQIDSLPHDDYALFHIHRDNKYLLIRGRRLMWSGVDAYILYISDETAEHERELHLEHLLNQIPTGVSTYHIDDHSINRIFMNDGFYQTFGISKLDYPHLSDVKAFSMVNTDDIPIIEEAIESMRNGASSCDFIYRSEIPGHKTMWIRLLGSVAERSGSSFSLYAGFMDVSTQIRAQIRQKELFDTIPSGILEFNYDGDDATILSANQTLLDMVGYSSKEVYSRSRWKLTEAVHPEDYHLLLEARDSVNLGKGKSYDFRLLNKKTGLFRWVSCDYTITERTKTGVKVISAFLDIEDKRKAEDASAAKSRFLSRMSHEIRTPINAIMGIAELERQDIEAGSISAENISRYSKETFAASHYLLTLVNDILDTSQIENNQITLQQHPTNVVEYLTDINTLISPLAKEKGVQFSVVRNTFFREVYIGDGVRVKQIIVNLLNNAIKFTPEGGSVTLICEAIAETAETTTLQFTVTDTGIGISPEFQERLFTPFTQEDSDNTSPFTGSGLGLSIAKSLAQKMGGDITCKSEQGKGSTFIATIVVGNGEPENIEDESDQLTEINDADLVFNGIHILVCEDHPINQKITKALLERKDCQVDIAEDGEIGVERFSSSPVGYYAMVLMDIRMPNMDGLQTTETIRHLNRPDATTVPIVAMSANAYDEDVKKSLAAGMNAHLAKPVDASILYKTIAHYTSMAEPQIEKPTVLVVDDIDINRAVLKEALRSNYNVLEAKDGMDALGVLEKNDEIIAVVTDLLMPVMDGADLIKNIRKSYCYEDVAILINTQYGDAEQEQELLTLGADDFIYKPTAPTILAIRLKNVLARRKHIL